MINIVSKQLQGSDINLLDDTELARTLRESLEEARAQGKVMAVYLISERNLDRC